MAPTTLCDTGGGTVRSGCRDVGLGTIQKGKRKLHIERERQALHDDGRHTRTRMARELVSEMGPKETRELLLLMRARLLELDEEMTESLAIGLEEESGEESSDQHMADVGTVTLSRELDLSVQGNTEHLLAQVDRALEKLDDGTYGLCDRCGGPIGEGRLRSMPYAVLCLEHQRELERSGGI